MTWQAIVAMIAGVLVLAASWAVALRRRSRSAAPTAPAVPSAQPILEAALGPVHDRLADDLGKIEDATETPTPATDVAAIAKARVRKPE